MRFASGTKLGRFEVVGLLGAGGMGEVYRATDTRLNRSVAIKIVPPEIAADPIWKERLRREAQMIAALQHPHICVLYDIAELDGVDCLIMEHIEGETLAERLRRGPLPLDEALRYAGEIVGALAAAHGVGIVHRDLKPANIMLTPSGAKLLDFGIAKRHSAGALGEARTADARLTAQVILGTLGYMAPEQLQGRDADERSDIFALGATLFELVTGHRAFAGASETERLAAVMAGRPDVAALERAAVPALVKSIVSKCLAADPERRWQAASDIADVLRWVDGDSIAAADGVSRPRAGRRAAWLAVGAVAGALAALAAVQWVRPPGPEPAQPLRLAVTAPPGTSFTERDITGHPQFALSPDGSRLAFVAARRGEPPLVWIRSLATGAAQPLAGTDDGSGPFWSPDGRFIGFFAHGKLKRVAAAGGNVQELADVSVSVEGGAWGSRDVIVFSRSTGGEGLFQVPATGGTIAPVTVLDPANEETGHRWPDFLPDGKHFLMFVRGAERGVYLADLDGGPKRLLLRTEANAVYAEPGRLLFEQGGTLMAQAFDLDAGTLVGEPVPLDDPIVSLSGPSYLPISVARNGMIAYWNGGPPMTRLEWIDRDGRPLGTIDLPYRSDAPRLSPDGQRVLLMQRRTNNLVHIWRADLETGVFSQLTFGADAGRFGIWSPDGESLVYAAPGLGTGKLFQKSASGAGADVTLLDAGRRYALFPEDWSADGRWLLYVETINGWDIAAYDAETSTSGPVLDSPANEIHARFSPTDPWFAYTSNESGIYEVYVQSFPDGAGKWRISTNGGSQPTWRGDGRELYYLAADGQLMAVPIGPGPAFEAGPPTALFATRLPPVLAPFRHEYAPAPDGQRFLLNNLATDREPTTITIVSGWQATLEARAE